MCTQYSFSTIYDMKVAISIFIAGQSVNYAHSNSGRTIPSVRLSVTLRIVSKWLNQSSKFFHRVIVPFLSSLRTINAVPKIRRDHS